MGQFYEWLHNERCILARHKWYYLRQLCFPNTRRSTSSMMKLFVGSEKNSGLSVWKDPRKKLIFSQLHTNFGRDNLTGGRCRDRPALDKLSIHRQAFFPLFALLPHQSPPVKQVEFGRTRRLPDVFSGQFSFWHIDDDRQIRAVLLFQPAYPLPV